MSGQRAASFHKVPAGVWTLGLVSLLMDASSEIVHSLLPLFLATTLGASALYIGLIEGLAESTALVTRVFSGALSDWLGRRKLLALAGYAIAALAKPFFALAGNAGQVLAARLFDRIGKGVRGAPRDALIADITPVAVRGAAFGLRQALDTVGAVAGPLLATALMIVWSGNFRAVFWVAVIPAVGAVLLLLLGVREPARTGTARVRNPIDWRRVRGLGDDYWRVVAIGALFTLARFSEAFLLLRAGQGGMAVSLVPLVMVLMNAVYALAAYPFGRLSDQRSHRLLLAAGLLVLLAADGLLGVSADWRWVLPGAALWGLHLGMTQGLLAHMVADAAPDDMRGTAFGIFNLAAGLALLLASLAAGVVWQWFGARYTFAVGGVLALLALLLVLARAPHGQPPEP